MVERKIDGGEEKERKKKMRPTDVIGTFSLSLLVLSFLSSCSLSRSFIPGVLLSLSPHSLSSSLSLSLLFTQATKTWEEVV